MAHSPQQPSRSPPGKGLFGWLGRQIGHVSRAITADVTKPPSAPSASGDPALYRKERVEEVPHPTQPDVVLRRTVIDEAVKVSPK